MGMDHFRKHIAWLVRLKNYTFPYENSNRSTSLASCAEARSVRTCSLDLGIDHSRHYWVGVGVRFLSREAAMVDVYGSF